MPEGDHLAKPKLRPGGDHSPHSGHPASCSGADPADPLQRSVTDQTRIDQVLVRTQQPSACELLSPSRPIPRLPLLSRLIGCRPSAGILHYALRPMVGILSSNVVLIGVVAGIPALAVVLVVLWALPGRRALAGGATVIAVALAAVAVWAGFR